MNELSPSGKAELLRWAIKFHQKSQDAFEALGLEALLHDVRAIEGLEDLTAPLASSLAQVLGRTEKLIDAHRECGRALAGFIQFLASDAATVARYREMTGGELPDELPGVM